MGDEQIEMYASCINTLLKETGISVKEDIKLYKDNKVIAIIKWDDKSKQYYPRYQH